MMLGFSIAALCTLAVHTALVSGQKLSKPAVRDSLPWLPGLLTYLHGPGWSAKQWPNGQITQRCKEMARDNQLAPTDFQIFEVTYDDCATPWLLCRHVRSNLDITQMMDRWGRVPPRMRQFASTIIWVPQDGVSGYAVGADICIKGNADNPWVYLHEVMHAMESSDAFNSTRAMTDQKRWLDAYNADDAVPDEYSRNNQHENVAQQSGILIFDKVYPGGLRNFDSEWRRYYRQQDTLYYEGTNGKYGGNEFQIGGQSCSARYALLPPVSASSTSRIKRWLDPRALLPSGIVWETIDQQRAKLKALGITLLDDVVTPKLLGNGPTQCSF